MVFDLLEHRFRDCLLRDQLVDAFVRPVGDDLGGALRPDLRQLVQVRRTRRIDVDGGALRHCGVRGRGHTRPARRHVRCTHSRWRRRGGRRGVGVCLRRDRAEATQEGEDYSGEEDRS